MRYILHNIYFLKPHFDHHIPLLMPGINIAVGFGNFIQVKLPVDHYLEFTLRVDIPQLRHKLPEFLVGF